MRINVGLGWSKYVSWCAVTSASSFYLLVYVGPWWDGQGRVIEQWVRVIDSISV
jgi:hypothetical protein